MKSLCRFAANRISGTLTPLSRQTISHLKFSSFLNLIQSTNSSIFYIGFQFSVTFQYLIPTPYFPLLVFPASSDVLSKAHFHTKTQNYNFSFAKVYQRSNIHFFPHFEYPAFSGVLSKAHITNVRTNCSNPFLSQTKWPSRIQWCPFQGPHSHKHIFSEVHLLFRSFPRSNP